MVTSPEVRSRFFARLRALHVAAGEPKLDSVARQASQQRVSAWMNENVPRTFSEFEPVVEALIVRAQKRRTPEPEPGMYSLARWQVWWRDARPSRSRVQAATPPNDAYSPRRNNQRPADNNRIPNIDAVAIDVSASPAAPSKSSSWTYESISIDRLQHSQLRHQAPVDEGALLPPTIGGVSRPSRLHWKLPEVATQPGIAADQARVGRLDVRAASIVGPSNRCDEPALPRQDCYRLGTTPMGSHLIVAIADGLSQSAHADVGAAIAATAAVRHIRELIQAASTIDSLDANRIFRAVADDMYTVAASRSTAFENISTTLLVAAVPGHPNSAGVRSVWLGWMNDTSAWLRKSGGWQLLTYDPERNQYENRLSAVLPFNPDQACQAVVTLPPAATLAMMTDGVGDAFTDVPGAQQWFSERWEKPPALASFVLDVGFEARGCGDDRTAVVIWCDPPPREGK